MLLLRNGCCFVGGVCSAKKLPECFRLHDTTDVIIDWFLILCFNIYVLFELLRKALARSKNRLVIVHLFSIWVSDYCMNYIMSDVDIVDIMLMKASALFMFVSIGYHSVNWSGVLSGALGTPNIIWWIAKIERSICLKIKSKFLTNFQWRETSILLPGGSNSAVM